jgi:hypothetical protein
MGKKIAGSKKFKSGKHSQCHTVGDSLHLASPQFNNTTMIKHSDESFLFSLFGASV